MNKRKVYYIVREQFDCLLSAVSFRDWHSSITKAKHEIRRNEGDRGPTLHKKPLIKMTLQEMSLKKKAAKRKKR